MTEKTEVSHRVPNFSALDLGNSTTKLAALLTFLEGALLDSEPVQENLHFLPYRHQTEIQTSSQYYCFTELDAAAFLADFKQELIGWLPFQDTSEIFENGFFGLTGFNNWLAVQAKIKIAEGQTSVVTKVFGEDPSLTAPFTQEVRQSLREVYAQTGIDADKNNAEKEVDRLDYQKPHYLLHSLTALTTDPELLEQVFSLKPSDEIVNLQVGDLQGWLLSELSLGSMPLGFVPQNLRSLGATTAEQAELILASVFNLEEAKVYSSSELRERKILSINDLNAEILMYEILFGSDNDRLTLVCSTDSVYKIIVPGLSVDQDEFGRLEQSSYLTQRTGGATGRVLQHLLSDRWLATNENIYECMGNFVGSFLENGELPETLRDFIFYPLEDNFGYLLKKEGESWRSIDLSQLKDNQNPAEIERIRAEIGEENLDAACLAIISGSIFGIKQKITKTADLLKKDKITLVLSGGQVGYHPEQWGPLFAELITLSEDKIDVQRLEGFQGSHQAILFILVKEAIELLNSGDIDLEKEDISVSQYINFLQQQLTDILPKLASALPPELEMNQNKKKIFAEYFQLWIQLQARFTRATELGALFQPPLPSPQPSR